VLRLESFRRAVEDPREAGTLLRIGCGHVLDSCGLDWWELSSLFVHAELETALAMRRLLEGVELRGNLYCTRTDWPVSGFTALGKWEVYSFSGSGNKVMGRVRRYARAFSRLSASQALDVIGDKYDADYRWRSRVRQRRKTASEPVVLIPSAYTNVTRGAVAYAVLLPELKFLLVATRRSALNFDPAPNVGVSDLAGYADLDRHRQEFNELVERWNTLRMQLQNVPELELLNRTGILDPIQKWLRVGLSIRDAWRNVLDREPVTAVLCGDDSNWYTRLPVVFARKRNLPTINFHHGALDGRFLLKTLSSDLYLAKNEMERDYLTRICGLPADRILVGGVEPDLVHKLPANGNRPNVVYFSEPYESIGARPEEIYRELLPPLHRLAAAHGRTLVVKLHPFESVQDRRRLIAEVLGSELANQVKLVDGALSEEVLSATWFGITVESSAVLDCTRGGVPCFHCLWLVATPWAYGEQYARFGVGRCLRSASEIEDIPSMLETPSHHQSEGKPLRPAGEILREAFSPRPVPTVK
jgi:hypothetical protein